jgi:hypothetical protein
MNESETSIAAGDAGSATQGRARRRATASPKPASRPKAARRTPAAKKRSSSRARPAARRSVNLQGLLQTLASKASDARGRIAAVSGDGAQATRRAWRKVSGASRETIDRLAADWKQMDSAKKAQFIAALLTALAAASAPLVRRGLKKR